MDIMRAMNKKQIPVCKSCHVKIHAEKYSGISLKNLPLKKISTKLILFKFIFDVDK
jgi:predicted HNH restriction endonuclease